VLETYDPSKGFAFVNKVTLIHGQDAEEEKKGEPYSFEKNSDEIIKECQWTSNGSVLIYFNRSDEYAYFFSHETGEFLCKKSCSLANNQSYITYDPLKH
jgi:hypothetical protein